jgi:hypothetical protein
MVVYGRSHLLFGPQFNISAKRLDDVEVLLELAPLVLLCNVQRAQTPHLAVGIVQNGPRQLLLHVAPARRQVEEVAAAGVAVLLHKADGARRERRYDLLRRNADLFLRGRGKVRHSRSRNANWEVLGIRVNGIGHQRRVAATRRAPL